MHALASGKARTAARTLLAQAGGVWMWPGIALTERRGPAWRSGRGGCRAFLDQPAAWPGGERLGGPSLCSLLPRKN